MTKIVLLRCSTNYSFVGGFLLAHIGPQPSLTIHDGASGPEMAPFGFSAFHLGSASGFMDEIIFLWQQLSRQQTQVVFVNVRRCCSGYSRKCEEPMKMNYVYHSLFAGSLRFTGKTSCEWFLILPVMFVETLVNGRSFPNGGLDCQSQP